MSELVGVGEGASVLLDDLSREPNTGLDGCLKVLALNDLGEESSDERVACTVGVNDEVLSNGWNGELELHSVITVLRDGDEDGIATLSDDGDAGTPGVGLLPLGY